MEVVALFAILIAVILFIGSASPKVSSSWDLTAAGLVFLSIALLIWHVFGGLEPLVD